MALTIEVRLNGRLIGTVLARNVSDLGTLSDYEVEASSVPLDDENGYMHPHRLRIPQHYRKRGAWALVARIAQALDYRENGR